MKSHRWRACAVLLMFATPLITWAQESSGEVAVSSLRDWEAMQSEYYGSRQFTQRSAQAYFTQHRQFHCTMEDRATCGFARLDPVTTALYDDAGCNAQGAAYAYFESSFTATALPPGTRPWYAPFDFHGIIVNISFASAVPYFMDLGIRDHALTALHTIAFTSTQRVSRLGHLLIRGVIAGGAATHYIRCVP